LLTDYLWMIDCEIGVYRPSFEFSEFQDKQGRGRQEKNQVDIVVQERMDNIFSTGILVTIFCNIPTQQLPMVACVSKKWKSAFDHDLLWKIKVDQLHNENLVSITDYNEQNSWKERYRLESLRFMPFLVAGSEADHARLVDIKTQLQSIGFTNVKAHNLYTSNKTEHTEINVNAYRAILFYPYHAIHQEEWGNLLANYVDEGRGGVVLTAFANYETVLLKGNWAIKHYDPLKPCNNFTSTHCKLGKFDQTHPIMNKVTSLYGNSSYKCTPTAAHDGTNVIAYWQH